MSASQFDVVIVGGGPAGLSAALVLGRARRRVVVVDEGEPRNAVSRALHGFLSRDGIAPSELGRISREQLSQYPNVELRLHDRVETAARTDDGFQLDTRDGSRFAGRKIILATGMVDELPEVPGLRELYGRSVFHCPYCDGWEVRDQPLAVYGTSDEHGGGLAIELLGWSRDITMCLDGRGELSPSCRDRLSKHGVRIREDRIERLEGRDGVLEHIVFADGSSLDCRALFFFTHRRQTSDLALQLGCDSYGEEGCEVQEPGKTNVPGLYIIGDASRDVLQVAVAVGEGTQAAVAVNAELIEEDFP